MLTGVSYTAVTAFEQAAIQHPVVEELRSSEPIQLREQLGRNILDVLARVRTKFPNFGESRDYFEADIEGDGRYRKMTVIPHDSGPIRILGPFRNYFGTPCLSHLHTLQVKLGKEVINPHSDNWNFQVVGVGVKGCDMTPFILASRKGNEEVILTPISIMVFPDYDTQDQKVGQHGEIWFDCSHEVPETLQNEVRRHLMTGNLTGYGNVQFHYGFEQGQA